MSPIPTTNDSSPAFDQTRWFSEEVQPYEPKVRAWLQARFPGIADIDDLIQETYLRLWRAKNAGKLEHTKAYFFATARNAALDRCRRAQIIVFESLAENAHSSVLVERTHEHEPTRREHELDILSAAISSLPGRCREILLLRKYHGLSHREIAEQLGISPHTVNAQLTIAMLKCREYFRTRGLIRRDPQ